MGQNICGQLTVCHTNDPTPAAWLTKITLCYDACCVSTHTYYALEYAAAAAFLPPVLGLLYDRRQTIKEQRRQVGMVDFRNAHICSQISSPGENSDLPGELSIQFKRRRGEQSHCQQSPSLSLGRQARHRWINGSSVVEEDRRSLATRNTHARHTRGTG